MKQFWTLIMCSFFVAGLAGCTDTKEPEQPGKPGVEEPEIFAGAIAGYAGDDLAPGMGHYVLGINTEGVTFNLETMTIQGKGEVVVFDLSAEMAEDPESVRLAAGTYAAADFETYEEFTFQRGQEDMGSFIMQVDNGAEAIDPITDGEVKIEYKGNDYVIGLTVKTKSGQQRTIKYEGAVTVHPIGEEEQEPEILAGANGIYTGDEFDSGTGHYMLALNMEGLTFDQGSWFFDGEGEFLWLDLNAALAEDPKHVRLVAGTYAAADFETYEEFTFQRGQEDLGSFMGQVKDGEETIDPIIDGELKIEDDGNEYVIRLTVKTESGQERMFIYEGAVAMQLFGISFPPEPFEGAFVNASGNYFGDYYEAGMGNIELQLTDMQIGEQGPVGPGHLLYLDINTTLFASQSAIALLPGTYGCDKASTGSTSMTFNAGFEQDGYLFGSIWVEYNSDSGEENMYAVTDGSVTVTGAGAAMKVTVSLKLDNGETRTGEYSGKISVNDGTCLSRMTGNVAPVCTKGRAIFKGEAEYLQNNSYNWVVWIATSGIDLDNLTGKGEMVQLSFNTTKDSTTEIPSGDYAVMPSIANQYLVPFSYIPGYFDQLRGFIMGSWYTKDLVALGPCAGGTLKIENKGGNNYVIEYDFVDDYHYAGGPFKISGRYEGALSYTDDSNPYGAPAKVKQNVSGKTPEKFKAAKKASVVRRAVRR